MPSIPAREMPCDAEAFTGLVARKSHTLNTVTACDVCGSEFNPNKPWQKRCSKRCGVAAHNARRRENVELKRCRTCTLEIPVANFAVNHRSCLKCEELRDSGRKQCRQCLQVKEWSDFYSRSSRSGNVDSVCKACKSARSKLGNATEEKRERNRETKYRARYGITTSDVQAMYEQQNGRCAVCNKEAQQSTFHVDHDHRTGAVRALLCHSCNALLGHAREDTEILRSAIKYLERHQS